MGEEETIVSVDDVVVNETKLLEKVESPVIHKKEQNGENEVKDGKDEVNANGKAEVVAEQMEEDKKDEGNGNADATVEVETPVIDKKEQNGETETRDGKDEVSPDGRAEVVAEQMEEDRKDEGDATLEVDAEQMDVDKEKAKEEEKSKEEKEDNQKIEVMEEEKVSIEEKEETKTEVMDEEDVSIEGELEEDKKDDKAIGSQEKTTGLVENNEEQEEMKETTEEREETNDVEDEMKEEQEEGKGSIEDYGSKKRKRGQSAVQKSAERTKKTEEKEQEPKTPASSDRPVRERKSVERLVAIIEKDTSKDFHIEKGRGTRLKDIPNVAYKLSRRKGEDTFKLLHSILFGRRGKAAEVKSNISRFSGFVWHDDEEKQKMKVKEKFEKCVKEKLWEFCDVLDIPFAKTTTKKDDIVSKLMDFLMAPHATTTELLAEKEQSSKGKKRVKEGSGSRSGGSSSRCSNKSRKKSNGSSKSDGNKSTSDTEDGSVKEEDEMDQEPENGIAEKSKDDNSEQSESEEKKDESEEESEEETKQVSKKKPFMKLSSGKGKSKEIMSPKKSTSQGKRTSKRPSSKPLKFRDDDSSPKVFSRKKKTDEEAIEKSSVSKRSVSKEKPVKKVVKGKEKANDGKTKPTEDELRNAICELLKEVDFNTATFTDILKQLAKRFNADLTPQKLSIKLMIQDELTKIADEADEEEEEEEDNGNAKKRVEAKTAEHGVEV